MISIIIPFHNEKKNITLLYRELVSQLQKLGTPYEIVFINDGSTDGSDKEATAIANKDNTVIYTAFQHKTGKGAALARGIEKSKGDIIVFMDSDLQDDPNYLGAFLKKLNEGYDLVNGMRVSRKHPGAIKTYSRMGNTLLRRLLHSPFTDVNCGFKMFRRRILDDIVIYANNFRFFPIAAYYRGYKVTEIAVTNRERRYGTTKFGFKKPFIGLIDTFTAYFLYQFAERPLHFFGTIGAVFFAVGVIVASYYIVERIVYHSLLYRRPLFLMALILIVVSVQIIATGFIGELIVYLNKKKL